MESIDDPQNALLEASAALYFSALSHDVCSVQTALCVLKCAESGQKSGQYGQNQVQGAIKTGFALFAKSLLTFYAQLVTIIEQLMQDKKIPADDYRSEQVCKIAREYCKCDFLSEEDRLQFMADVKETLVEAEKCLRSLQGSFKTFAQGVCKLARICIQEPQGSMDPDQLEEAVRDANIQDGELFIHIYRLVTL